MTIRAVSLSEVAGLLSDTTVPQVVGIVGPPGIGKSHLLREVAATLDGRTIVVHGNEDETSVPWAGVEQVARALRGCTPQLSPAQRAVIDDVLSGAHRVGGTDTPIESISVAAAIHALVCAAAREHPLTLAVDDAHWLDDDSRHALRYLGRRLLGEPVRMLTTARRDDEALTSRLVRLGGLDTAEAATLLRTLDLAPQVAERVAQVAGGIPLVLVHVAARLTDDERRGAAPLPEPLPIDAADLPGALAHRIATLDRRTRHALHVLAVGHPFEADWASVLARCGVDPADLEDAEAAGLVSMSPRRAGFTHALHRAAALADATPAQRRAVHGRLAESLGDADRRLVHRARSLLGTDDEVAAQLDDLADRHWHHGACASAAEHWRQAAALWTDDRASARSLVRAARSDLRAGNIAPARRLVDDLVVDDGTSTDLVELAAAYHLAHGDLDTGHALLLRCARQQPTSTDGPDEPAHAAAHLFEAARHRVRHGDMAGIVQVHGLLAELSDRLDHRARAKLAALSATVGNPAANGDVLIDAVATLLPPAGSTMADLAYLADVVALPLAFSRRYEDALDLVGRLRAEAVRTNQPAVVPVLDTTVACALSRYDLPGCVVAASSAVEWADELDQPNLATTALMYLVAGEALLGNEAVFAAADRLRPSGPLGWLTADMGIGTFWLTVGRPERCLEALVPLHDWLGGELKAVQFWQADLGEAAVRTGDRTLARAAADELARFDSIHPNSWLTGAHARVEGLLADPDRCDEWFARSVEAFRGARATVAEARSQLLWGERLRRARRRAEARPHLDAAHDLFVRVGAGRWAARCEHELGAAGAAAPRGDLPRPADQVLTPHELRVARLAVAGGSYKSIAAEMFLSPRTIETHLSTVYRKLGVRNRGELAAAGHHDPALRRGDPSLG